jgi:hypothetical protein
MINKIKIISLYFIASVATLVFILFVAIGFFVFYKYNEDNTPFREKIQCKKPNHVGFNLICKTIPKVAYRGYPLLLDDGRVLFVDSDTNSKEAVIYTPHYYHFKTIRLDSPILLKSLPGQKIFVRNLNLIASENKILQPPVTIKNITFSIDKSIFLKNGNFLLLGSKLDKSSYGHPKAALWISKEKKIIEIPPFSQYRNKMNAIKLKDGTVLIIGGEGNLLPLKLDRREIVKSVEVYIP